MEYIWAMEQRLNMSYEISIDTALKRMKYLKGKDRDALCEEWFEVLVRDMEDVDSDYSDYWTYWSCIEWKYFSKNNLLMGIGIPIHQVAIKGSASLGHLKEQQALVEDKDWWVKQEQY